MASETIQVSSNLLICGDLTLITADLPVGRSENRFGSLATAIDQLFTPRAETSGMPLAPSLDQR